MRSLLFACLWFLTAAVYAASCGSYLKRTDTSGVATVDCPSCNNMNDFASYGAAMLYTSRRYNTAYVTNGAKEIEVILRLSTRSTPHSLGFFGYSYNFQATNYAERLVDAFPRRGSVSGAPWNRQPVSTSSLSIKCKQIEEEQAAKEKAEKERQEQEKKAEQTSQYYYNKYLQTDAYKKRQSFIQETNNRWQRMLDWELILRTKYNDHRTICSPTYSGVRCDRYSRNFNGY